MNYNQKIKRVKNLTVTKIDNDYIVYNNNNSNTHILNETGGLIIENINNITFDELCNVIKKQYKIKFQSAIEEKDFNDTINNFVSQLINLKLVELIGK